jgi:hypothetical protein
MDSFEEMWRDPRDENYGVRYEEPDEEIDSPDVAPEFEYDAGAFYTDEV